MNDRIEHHIDDDTINQLGLKISDKPIGTQHAPGARVFEYPELDDVFIMENDLYGTPMPEQTCFIAFNGRHGLVGRDISIEQLRNSSVDDIRNLVAHNSEG